MYDVIGLMTNIIFLFGEWFLFWESFLLFVDKNYVNVK